MCMKRSLIILFITGCIAITCHGQSIYSISFSGIDGNTISLNNYQGKRVLVLLAPMASSDSSRLEEIRRFQIGNPVDSVLLIGVMSVEDGYTAGNKEAIKSLYQSRNINIILTEGMQTKKEAGNNQSALMRFLTHKSENGKFETESRGIYQKYFINRSGKLIGLAPPEASLFGNIAQALLAREN
jgi:glutathione peroxidase-family protein